MKTLFENEWMRVVNTDDDYTFTQCPKLKNGNAVAVLGFRFTSAGKGIEFLIRNERLPAHQNNMSDCALTGCCEDDDVMVDAIRELEEEGGYTAKRKEMISLGTVRPSKSSDTVVHLFAANLTDKERGDALGDGSSHEEEGYCHWVNHTVLMEQEDTLNHSMFLRLMAVAGGDIRMKVPRT